MTKSNGLFEESRKSNRLDRRFLKKVVVPVVLGATLLIAMSGQIAQAIEIWKSCLVSDQVIAGVRTIKCDKFFLSCGSKPPCTN